MAGAHVGLGRLVGLSAIAAVLAGCTLAGGTGWPRGGATARTPLVTISAAPVPAPSTTLTAAAPPPSAASSPAPPAKLHVVGLGDSVMAGEGCDCEGIPAAYGRLIAPKHPGVTIEAGNLGLGGATSEQLRDALAYDAGTQAIVSSADVVLLEIGANDLEATLDPTRWATCDQACWTPSVQGVRERLTTTFRSVRALRGGRPTTFLVAGYWNVYRDGQVGRTAYGPQGVAWARTVTMAVNGAIRDAALANGMTYVDVVAPFDGPAGTGDATGLLAPDGDHPNAEGVQAIARAFAAAVPS